MASVNVGALAGTVFQNATWILKAVSRQEPFGTPLLIVTSVSRRYLRSLCDQVRT